MARTRTGATVTVATLAVSLMALRYAADLPLRTDEIRLALNLFARDWTGLVQPLDHGQAAPPGFLWLVDGCVALLGRSGYALRLVPWLAALGCVPRTGLLGPGARPGARA